MLWVWLMGLITLGLLVWFGMKVFSGGVSPENSSDSGASSAGGSSSGGEGHAVQTAEVSADDVADAGADTTHKAQADSAAAMGAVAATGAVAAAANASTSADDAASGSTPAPAKSDNGIVYNSSTSSSSAGLGESGHAQGVTDAVASEDANSVREMIKILNLRDSDASRLGIEKDQFQALWQGSSDGVPAGTLSDVRSRLQQMMS